MTGSYLGMYIFKSNQQYPSKLVKNIYIGVLCKPLRIYKRTLKYFTKNKFKHYIKTYFLEDFLFLCLNLSVSKI